jgi:Amino acid permease
VPLFDLQPCDW